MSKTMSVVLTDLQHARVHQYGKAVDKLPSEVLRSIIRAWIGEEDWEEVQEAIDEKREELAGGGGSHEEVQPEYEKGSEDDPHYTGEEED